MSSENNRKVRAEDPADIAPGDNTTRARNRTVMLTPEVAGNVRARLGGEVTGEVFEPAIALGDGDDSDTQDWSSPLVENEPTSTAFGYATGEDDGLKSEAWSQEETEAILDEYSPASGSAAFKEAEDSGEAYSEQETRSSAWEQPQVEAEEEPRFVAPARIVRAGAASPVSRSETHVAPPEPVWIPSAAATHESYETEIEEIQSGPTSSVSDEHFALEPEDGSMGYERIIWKTHSKLVGFLVSYDNNPLGAFVELRKGRLLITSEGEGSGNCLVVNHETVSPMHAIMRIAEDGAVQVLDQLSEHGTRIIRGGHGQDAGEDVLLSGEKASLRNGDVLSFGDRKFHVCLVVAG
jgi:hypothetical protein